MSSSLLPSRPRPGTMRWSPHAGSILLALTAALPAQEDDAPVLVQTGTYYVLNYHGGDEVLAEQALAVVEDVWPIVADALGAGDQTPEQPLSIHLYRTLEDYRAADQQLTGGRFQRNLAMSHWDTRSAHVAVQPPSRAGVLRALGLPTLTVALLAWEAAHLARFELCPNFRQHPEWFVDGFAAWVSSRVLDARDLGTPQANPYWSSDMHAVQQLLDSRKLPRVREILADGIDELDLRDRYALRFVFFSFVTSEPQRGLEKVVTAIRSTTEGRDYQRRVLSAATGAWGRLDRQFARYVQDLRPEWHEVYRSLTTTENEWRQIAFPGRNAVAWQLEPIKGNGFLAKGGLRILPGDAVQLNFLFGRTDDGFYSVAFVADQGFTVFDHRSKTNEWIRIGSGNAPGLRLGVRSEFEIEARANKLVVRLDNLHWDLDLPRPLPREVVWGLGAQAGREGAATGAAGLWQGLSVSPVR